PEDQSPSRDRPGRQRPKCLPTTTNFDDSYLPPLFRLAIVPQPTSARPQRKSRAKVYFRKSSRQAQQRTTALNARFAFLETDRSVDSYLLAPLGREISLAATRRLNFQWPFSRTNVSS